MTKHSPFSHFKTSPEVLHLAALGPLKAQQGLGVGLGWASGVAGSLSLFTHQFQAEPCRCSPWVALIIERIDLGCASDLMRVRVGLTAAMRVLISLTAASGPQRPLDIGKNLDHCRPTNIFTWMAYGATTKRQQNLTIHASEGILFIRKGSKEPALEDHQ